VVRWLVLLALPACLSLPPRPSDNGDAGGGDDAPAMPTRVFGNDTVYGNPNLLSTGIAIAASSQAPTNGDVHSIVVYLDGATADTSVKAGMYGLQAGNPDVLIVQSDVMAVTGSGWLRIPISPQSVDHDQIYWLAVMCLSSCDSLHVMTGAPFQAGTCFAQPGTSCVDVDRHVMTDLPGNWASDAGTMTSLSIYASDQ